MPDMERTSDIRIRVGTNPEGVQSIHWEADDGLEGGVQVAQAMILALWDPEQRNAMRIDLWTPGFTVDDMNDFVYQTLLSLADSYVRATNNQDLMLEIKNFARTFAQRAAEVEQRRSGN
jgi:gliding motility-associated protein GldC